MRRGSARGHSKSIKLIFILKFFLPFSISQNALRRSVAELAVGDLVIDVLGDESFN